MDCQLVQCNHAPRCCASQWLCNNKLRISYLSWQKTCNLKYRNIYIDKCFKVAIHSLCFAKVHKRKAGILFRAPDV